MAEQLDFTTPVGRLIGGSLYDPRTTNYEGKPLVAADGITPRVDYQIGIAVPKTPGIGHWANEEWLKQLWNFGHAQFPSGEAQSPTFSWKVTDGDSTIPNKAGRKPVDNEGYPGHWVLWLSGGFAPQVWSQNGSERLLQKDHVMPGDYVQAYVTVRDNKPSKSPGVYLNHSMVALQGFGTRIVNGPDVSAAKFGQGVTLPAGASATPIGGLTPPPPSQGAAGAAPSYVPPTSAPAVSAPSATTSPSSAPPPPVAVAPNPGILTPPAGDPRNAKLTGTAGAVTYEQLIAAGWNDGTLVQHGHMTA